MTMQYTPTPIPQLLVVELDPRVDERGFFARAWCGDELTARGLTGRCLQASLSFNSLRGTLRGMHYQMPPHCEAKFVRAIRGAVHDVVLDLRRDSPTYGTWFAQELSADNRRALFVPEGCAHGFLTLTNDAELLYLISTVYQPHVGRGVHWDCPALQNAWPFAPAVISETDQQLPRELPDTVV